MLQHKLNRALRDPRILDIKVVVESKQPASRQGLVAKPEIGESFLPGVAAVDVAEREALTEIAGSEVARGARQDTDEAGVLDRMRACSAGTSYNLPLPIARR
jgi:hypothetical protein